MHARLLTLPLAAALLCLTACDLEDFAAVSRYSRDFHSSYPLKPDGRLEVENFNGSIEVSGWDQPTVDISGTKYGPTQEAADSLRVDIENSPDSVSVRVVRPFERRNNLGARLAIKIPRDAILDRITTSNGHIRTMDGAGPARLHTSNGSIRVEDLRGGLNAETSNGPLDISLGPDFSGNLRASTSNGSITLRAASEPNARVTARTSNGSIHCDFDMRVQGEIGRNRLDGTLGRGGGLIELSTSNGTIRLARR
jgi:hypothetical protein